MASDMSCALDGIVPRSVEATSDANEAHSEHLLRDEDIASQSTSSPAIFDKSEGSGTTWQRYGSLESTASTGITSFGSSGSADDSIHVISTKLNQPHKRTADGRVKPSSSELGFDQSPSYTDSIEHNSQEETVAGRKRRGRQSKSVNVKVTDSRLNLDTTSFKARSSIPHNLSVSTYANQCIEAALSSRLNPYALHSGEHKHLNGSIPLAETTVYLNIRNSILRLWLRNPVCSVTIEEAAGCAKESRFFGLAVFAHKWLSRNGYINFGCIEVVSQNNKRDLGKGRRLPKQRTVVVVGAGVSGLTTARQLENHFALHEEDWLERGERPPKVIILEGRKRIGGRVYSKPLRSQDSRQLPGEYRNTAEMGAMIVTGFERGNPLDIIIRAQLGLPYHLLKDALTIYDVDGKPVDEKRDLLNMDIYADISDKTGEFRAQQHHVETLRGDEELIRRARDPAQVATDDAAGLNFDDSIDPLRQRKPISRRGRRTNAPPGNEKISARGDTLQESRKSLHLAEAVDRNGWEANSAFRKEEGVSLAAIAASYQHPSLGMVMDAAIQQYQPLLGIKPRDMRLLNWHHANLEYANAAPVSRLSLSGHDQDNGNEFEGAHSEIIGGYTQMPRGLMNMPTKLDVRFAHTVQSIHYQQTEDNDGRHSTKVLCTNGAVIEADEIVLTAPLGVLKTDMIAFEPALPAWKQGAIDRMGFGLLNKLILVYDAPFWDESRDMFGLLNEAEEKDSLDPKHYEARRGRYYLIWNATRISGRYMLIALMAGHAAYQAETTDTTTMLREITDRLKRIFRVPVPAPQEVIVTRWRNDKFTRGTYSYVAERTRPDDYNLMARPVGNLHFAGEATCVTHPATVHGALLSGLRAAADVMDSMLGEIELPLPMKEPIVEFQETISRPTKRRKSAASPAIKLEPDTAPVTALPYIAPFQGRPTGPPSKSVCSTDPSFWAMSSFNNTSDILEATIASIVFAKIGERPLKPARSGINPFLLFSKANWDECKAKSAQQGNTSGGRNAIRQILGQWWKDMSEADKQPYLDQSKIAQDSAEDEHRSWTTLVAQWDTEAARIRQDYLRENPAQYTAGIESSSRRRTNVSTSIALDFSRT